MASRMDKYKSEEVVPTRSNKNKELYKQIYNAYDNFENLVIPSNAREIKPSDLIKEVTSRDEYRKQKDYEIISNKVINSNNTVIRKEKVMEEQEKENEIYDINQLLNNAISANKKTDIVSPTLSNDDYLKKLKLDNTKTNIEQVKEIFDDIKKEENSCEDEALMKTANLSLEILSDLKGDNDKTMVSAPIKEEELPNKDITSDFYSSTYKFSKKDFEDKDYERVNEEDDDEDDEDNRDGGRFFFKILMLIFGILIIILILLYCINYFNRV